MTNTCWSLSAWMRAHLRVMAFIDTALAYDPVKRRCDLVFNGTDFVLDDTPVTAVLTAIGLDRRAHPDDEVPDPTPQTYAPATLNARRGWAGDALDTLGRLVGSRMWLLVRKKQNEATRLLAESALQEALEPLANARGWPISVTVRWVRAGVLGWQAVVGQVTIAINQAIV
jgi:phage gp46-like protein